MCPARCAALQGSGRPASLTGPGIVLMLAVGGGGVAELLGGQMSLGRQGVGGGAQQGQPWTCSSSWAHLASGVRMEAVGCLVEWSGGIGRPCGR